MVRFGLGMRALRRRRRWTQQRLASSAGISASVISRIERGRADRVTVRTLIRVVAALDARIDVRLFWHGEALDRLTDARHADLVERTIAMLIAEAWVATAEVTFDIRGQRGSIDVLAFHPGTAALLVIEVKSVVPDMQAMLSARDRKTRLASEIARMRGWSATTRRHSSSFKMIERRSVASKRTPRRFEPPFQPEPPKCGGGSRSRPARSAGSYFCHLSPRCKVVSACRAPGRPLERERTRALGWIVGT